MPPQAAASFLPIPCKHPKTHQAVDLLLHASPFSHRASRHEFTIFAPRLLDRRGNSPIDTVIERGPVIHVLVRRREDYVPATLDT